MATKVIKGETFENLNASFTSTVQNAGLHNYAAIYAYKYHNLAIITGFIRVQSSELPANTVIATVSGINAPREVFTSSVSDSNSLLRIKMAVNGNIMIETKLPVNNWFSFSFVTYTSS